MYVICKNKIAILGTQIDENGPSENKFLLIPNQLGEYMSLNLRLVRYRLIQRTTSQKAYFSTRKNQLVDDT